MAPVDYGTIEVRLLPNLTEDQTYIIIQQTVENQVFSRNRNHYNQILNQCAHTVLKNPDISLNINWIMSEYTYCLKIKHVT